MTIRILQLEDSALDAELVGGYLRRAELDFSLCRVGTREAFLEALGDPPDLILADHTLPDFDGIEALRIASRTLPSVPFIFVSGTLGEDLAIECIKDGATDYVLKQNLRRLIPAIERALAEAASRRERERAEEERQASERQLRVLVAELSHRVGNILAVVQSIAQQTLRNSDSLAGFERHFMARLQSLAQAHALLIRYDWRGASLEEVLRTELAPFQGEGPRWSLEGPHVGISPGAAMTMALIFHELATNAAKYGALRRPEGHVRIAWAWQKDAAAAEESRLRVSWEERNGPPVRAPKRKVFGSRLISQVSRSLQGSAKVDYRPEGLSCVIDLPGSHVLPEEEPPFRAVLDGLRSQAPAAF